MIRKIGQSCICGRWIPGFAHKCTQCGEVKLSVIIDKDTRKGDTEFMNSVRAMIGLGPIPSSPIQRRKTA